MTQTTITATAKVFVMDSTRRPRPGFARVARNAFLAGMNLYVLIADFDMWPLAAAVTIYALIAGRARRQAPEDCCHHGSCGSGGWRRR